MQCPGPPTPRSLTRELADQTRRGSRKEPTGEGKDYSYQLRHCRRESQHRRKALEWALAFVYSVQDNCFEQLIVIKT